MKLMMCKRLDSNRMQKYDMQVFLSMNPMYGKEKNYILLNHKKALKTMQLSNFGMNTMLNYQPNASKKNKCTCEASSFSKHKPKQIS